MKSTISLLLLCLASGLYAPASAAEQPNIIFMLSDDQAWNGLSVAMHPTESGSKSRVFKTPPLEKFAADGMRFSAAYAPAPVCSPTRISLQTGMTNDSPASKPPASSRTSWRDSPVRSRHDRSLALDLVEGE